MEKLVDISCRDFAEVLAAKESVPGGGGAAAYAGALGVALASMVANFTTGKQAYAAYETDIQRILEQAEAIRCRLLDLVDEDAAAFFPLSQAYAIPKDDPARAETLETCIKAALVCPLEMMQQICMAIELLEELNEKGSRLLLSDVGCAAALCRGALEAAAMNVFINTAALSDRSYACNIEAECDAMLVSYVASAEALVSGVTATLRSGSA